MQMLKMKIKHKNKKVVDTWTSQAVPHLSTNHALSRLTSEFERDPVFSDIVWSTTIIILLVIIYSL